MKYTIQELVKLGTVKHSRVIVATSLIVAKLHSERTQIYQGTVIMLSDSNGSLHSKATGKNWSKVL